MKCKHGTYSNRLGKGTFANICQKIETKIDLNVNWIMQYRHVNGRSPNESTMCIFFLRNWTPYFKTNKTYDHFTLIVQLKNQFRFGGNSCLLKAINCWYFPFEYDSNSPIDFSNYYNFQPSRSKKMNSKCAVKKAHLMWFFNLMQK